VTAPRAPPGHGPPRGSTRHDREGDLLEAEREPARDPDEERVAHPRGLGGAECEVHGRTERQDREHLGVGGLALDAPIHDQHDGGQGSHPPHRGREEASPDEVHEPERAEQRHVCEPMDGLDRRAAEREQGGVHEERARRLLIEGVPVRELARQPVLRHVGVRPLVTLEGNRHERGAHDQRERGDESEWQRATPRGHRGRHRALRRGGPRAGHPPCIGTFRRGR